MNTAAFAAALLAALFGNEALAQSLVDPMRPPTARDDAAVAVTRSAGPVLEQIVLGDGRKFAVINGRRLALGDKLGEATVVDIGTDHVTLKGGTTQVLRMFPGSGKTGAGDGSLLPQRRKAEEGS